uniref:Uncharacterized protein n=1 Tax=Anguilla anguilla TaxID=7936 RepID=A0A0E9PDD6_ANGAN
MVISVYYTSCWLVWLALRLSVINAPSVPSKI